MFRFSLFLSVVFVLTPLSMATSAGAALTALVSVHEGGADMWQQRERIRELFQTRYGFNEVRFLVDATADEIPGRMKGFLEQAADVDDRRLVWVSGFNLRKDGSICADATFATIQPTAASLIMAPRCFTDIIALPQGARHFSLTVPAAATERARIGRTRASMSPWIALITLPSFLETAIQGTNNLILDHLGSQPNNQLDPAALLSHLRTQFRWNGSDFTPTLDLFDRGILRQRLWPFATTSQPPGIAQRGIVRRVQGSAFALYSTPDASNGLTLSGADTTRIRVLRRDRSGQMSYVAVGRDFYGWVKTNVLAE